MKRDRERERRSLLEPLASDMKTHLKSAQEQKRQIIILIIINKSHL